jgi:hypothetical protein
LEMAPLPSGNTIIFSRCNSFLIQSSHIPISPISVLLFGNLPCQVTACISAPLLSPIVQCNLSSELVLY